MVVLTSPPQFNPAPTAQPERLTARQETESRVKLLQRQSVVQINCTIGNFDPMQPYLRPTEAKSESWETNFPEAQQAAGSGFFIDVNEGWIVTNAHVVDRAYMCYVISDVLPGVPLDVTVAADSPERDVALLILKPAALARIKPFVARGEIKALQFVDDELRQNWLGTVYAAGYPLGLPGVQETAGKITGEYTYTRPNGIPQSYLRTDTAINGGNSGGPLLNQNGEVIGITSAGFQGASGLNFAIPARIVVSTLQLLFETARSPHAKTRLARVSPIDFTFRSASPAMFAERGYLPGAEGKLSGLYVISVRPPIERTMSNEIQSGDIILAIEYQDPFAQPGAFAIGAPLSRGGNGPLSRIYFSAGDRVVFQRMGADGVTWENSRHKEDRTVLVHEFVNMLPVDTKLRFAFLPPRYRRPSASTAPPSSSPDLIDGNPEVFKTQWSALRAYRATTGIRELFMPYEMPEWEVFAGMLLSTLHKSITEQDACSKLGQLAEDDVKRLQDWVVVLDMASDSNAKRVSKVQSGDLLVEITHGRQRYNVTNVGSLRHALLDIASRHESERAASRPTSTKEPIWITIRFLSGNVVVGDLRDIAFQDRTHFIQNWGGKKTPFMKTLKGILHVPPVAAAAAATAAAAAPAPATVAPAPAPVATTKQQQNTLPPVPQPQLPEPHPQRFSAYSPSLSFMTPRTYVSRTVFN